MSQIHQVADFLRAHGFELTMLGCLLYIVVIYVVTQHIKPRRW